MSHHEQEPKKIQVRLQTRITHDGVTENYDWETTGTSMKKGTSLYLQYEENHEAGKTRTTVKMKEDETVLLRKGAVSMRQLFRPSERTNGHYESIYGTISMLTDTETIEHVWNETAKQGVLRIVYSLEMMGAEPGRYEMTIRYKEEV